MNEFVEECRREWRRLGVPDPVANEMAADLNADLEEAEAEGASPEDVLGNSAFDPRRFAAAWAVAQGVAGPPQPDGRQFWRTPYTFVLAALLGALAAGAGLVLLVGVRGQSVAVAVRRVVGGQGSQRIFPPGPGRFGPFAGFVGTHVPGAAVLVLGVLLLCIGGAVGLGLLAVLHRSPRSGGRRFPRGGGGRTPSWN